MTGVVASKKGSNAIVNFVKDTHGNVVAMGSNHSVTGAYNYSAFGNQIESTNTLNPFRYCGEYYDNESGLTYLRNRYYDSETGRFINEDPIRDRLNWYVYCGNEPLMRVDPWGLRTIVDKESADKYNKKYNRSYIDDITNFFNELSDDSIANDGHEIFIEQRHKSERIFSTSLSRAILNCDVDVVFMYKESASNTQSIEINPDGTKCITINFDQQKDYSKDIGGYIIDAEGNFRLETNPDPVVVFAHELNHASAKIFGDPYAEDFNMYNVEVLANPSVNITQPVSKCEIMNIGLPYISDNGETIYPSPYRITENAIRMERDGSRRVSIGIN